MNELPNIRHLPYHEIEHWVLENGEKKFRAKQLYEWIWKKHASGFDAMSNISKLVAASIANFVQPGIWRSSEVYCLMKLWTRSL